jgi:hypothetical protein
MSKRTLRAVACQTLGERHEIPLSAPRMDTRQLIQNRMDKMVSEGGNRTHMRKIPEDLGCFKLGSLAALGLER